MSLTDVPLIKCVILGDDQSGKVNMMSKYASINGLPFSFQDREIVTAFNGQKVIFIDGDTSLEEENRPFRDAHVFLLCASVASQQNVEQTVKVVMNTIIEQIGNIPFVLVGTQIENRTATKKIQTDRPMPLHQAELFAERIGASKYLECSAKTGEGLDEVFEDSFSIGENYALGKLRRERRKKLSGEQVERKQSCITQ